MFLFFKGQTSTQSVFSRMQSQADVLLSSKKTNFNPIQVDAQLPTWLKQSNNGQVSNFGIFLQSYYDWLSNNYGFTGINVMDIPSMMDIDSTPDFLLPHFIETYAPDIMGIYDLPDNEKPSDINIRNTIRNIKTELYQKKSNEDAFRSLMGSLFSIDPDTIQFSYPKRKILRLNAGALDWMTDSTYYGETGEYSNERYTIVGSYLNQGVFHDGKLWQDFSYIVTSDVNDDNPYYEAVVKETLHPTGLLGLYEKLESYSEGGYVPQAPLAVYEVTSVRNYKDYSLLSSGSLPICTGCTGTKPAPTFSFPADLGPNFASIRVSDLAIYRGSNESIGITCGLACTATGNINFDWYVDTNSYTNSLLTPEVPFDPDADGRFGIGG